MVWTFSAQLISKARILKAHIIKVRKAKTYVLRPKLPLAGAPKLVELEKAFGL